ncbi:hypothetical protein [Paenibacillus sp.]|uniref:hypothetical protein n=1 Tax=Paenibacillus sp. TaxID=58172 RepID=UPI002817F9A7|nr:hypothetical protein [Paenibacillus sp.]MDR0268244.1 hypothetical protein [Paenibacillus sp.]
MKQAKPVRTRSVNNVRSVNSLNTGSSLGGAISTNQRNQIALIAAVLFVIAALLSLFVAWDDLKSGGTSETLI